MYDSPRPLELSRLANDPAVGPIVAQFAAAMPERIHALLRAFDAGDWSTLAWIAHDLRGSAGNCGFAAVGSLAARLERQVRHDPREDAILRALEELILACRAVRAGAPRADL